ncbi:MULTISPECIES: hypothetical protein [Cupriavidus]|jgi:hypothetical protein|uniref:hypothetical protein n=1 Tax=Cupriavidus TaxID=106589 RepID=UPI00079906AD|nr:hypothetical protein [Cupriavidus metallidurans]KWW32397.1 hypothetical protein AU374_05997 [Cupriavidus metallidurans]
MGNTKSAAGCQFPAPPLINRPTVRQAAKRLLVALERLSDGMEAPGFHGWENGNGDQVGDEVEEARHELEVLLAETPRASQLLTGADFDPSAFEAVWRSDAVQLAGRDYGFRGIAEAIWAAAFCQAQEPLGATPTRVDDTSRP